jgi:hypothetical protein
MNDGYTGDESQVIKVYEQDHKSFSEILSRNRSWERV